MLTRREVEGELRNLGFRESVRRRRAEREKALRFARGFVGVAFGVVLLALLGAVNFISTPPADLAFGHTNARASEWGGGGSGSGAAPHRTQSLFFTGRRTWHPDDPRSHRHRSSD